MSSISEIAPNVSRLSIAPSSHFEFNSFLIKDKNPCLVHTGKSSFFTELKSMVDQVLNGKELKYIVFSHVEADECGAVNEWLKAFPKSKVICNKISNICLDNFLIRPAKVIKDDDTINLGSKSLQMLETPHFPHNWDAHMWYETYNKILFSSDFLSQGEVCQPTVETDISDKIISFYDKGGFMPYGKTTNESLLRLSKISFKAIAPMHGSTIVGNSSRIVFDKVKTDLESRS